MSEANLGGSNELFQKVQSWFLGLSPKQRLGVIVLTIVCFIAVSRTSCSQSQQVSTLNNIFDEQGSGLGEAENLTAEQESPAPDSQSSLPSIEPSSTVALPSEQSTSQSEVRSNNEGTKPTLDNVGPFRFIQHEQRRPIAITQDPEGNVIVGHRYGLSLFKGGSELDAKILLDRQSFESEFNSDLRPIASMGIVGGDIWIGLFNGQLMRYRSYEWKLAAAPQAFNSIKVTGIAGDDSSIFFVSRALYKWDASYERPIGDPYFRDKLITTFAYGNDRTLLAAGPGGLWSYDKGTMSWKPIWTSSASTEKINVVIEADDHTYLLGGAHGVLRISKQGVIIERLFARERIYALASIGEKGLLIGTQNNGLKYWDGEKLFSSDTVKELGLDISSLFVDQQKRLWVGVDGKGVYVAPVAEAISWLTSFPVEQVNNFKPEVFGNACQAAAKILNSSEVSGDVTAETIDGTLTVFFRGHQVCPRNVGYRRADGAVMQLQGWDLLIFIGKQRAQVAVPKEIAADRAKIMLLDSKDRLWLGTGQATHVFANNNWQTLGVNEQLRNNPITSIIEDRSGNIWIGSIPPYNQHQKSYDQANLHLFNNQGHLHFGINNSLIYHVTQSLISMKDETLLVGTNAGVSVITPERKVTNIGEPQGLVPCFVASLALDKKQRIWIAHQYFGNGITVFDGEHVNNFDSTKGIFSDRIQQIAHDQAGRVWLMGTNGNVGVYPASLFENTDTATKINTKRVRSRKLL